MGAKFPLIKTILIIIGATLIIVASYLLLRKDKGEESFL